MTNARESAIKFGKDMEWNIPNDVKFHCDDCKWNEECHHAFDPTNMILKTEMKCLSESIGTTQWAKNK